MEFLLPLIIAASITGLAMPFTIWFAKKYGLVDDPSKRPHPAHVQTRIVPRAGGLAIFLGLVITILIFIPFTKALVGILAGLSILLIMGLADDKFRDFSPYGRLFLLFLAALAPVAAGIGITFINNPFYHFPLINLPFNPPLIRLDYIVWPIEFLGRHNIVLIADLVAFFWIVTLTQVINWAKGVDGQMPGITLVSALTLGLFSTKLFFEGDPNQLPVAQLAFIVAGASLGFLVFNWHPAKIFPGFSGSTILAFMLAILAILSGAKLATACLVLAIPIIDFVYTFCRRILQGRSPVWGDRGHLHHKLLDMGWSHQQITLFYMIGSAILGAVALFIETESKFFTILAVATGFLLFILWLNSFGAYSARSGRDNG